MYLFRRCILSIGHRTRYKTTTDFCLSSDHIIILFGNDIGSLVFSLSNINYDVIMTFKLTLSHHENVSVSSFYHFPSLCIPIYYHFWNRPQLFFSPNGWLQILILLYITQQYDCHNLRQYPLFSRFQWAEMKSVQLRAPFKRKRSCNAFSYAKYQLTVDW